MNQAQSVEDEGKAYSARGQNLRGKQSWQLLPLVSMHLLLLFTFWQSVSALPPPLKRAALASGLRARAVVGAKMRGAGQRIGTSISASRRHMLTKLRCRTPQHPDQFPPIEKEFLEEQAKYVWGWPALWDTLDKALMIVTVSALSCDKNVLLLLSGQSTPRECALGMVNDVKRGYATAWTKLQVEILKSKPHMRRTIRTCHSSDF